jgi:hypothetical protein
MRTLNSKRKDYKITNKMIAKLFGYSTRLAFQNSSARDRILKGIDSLIELIELIGENKKGLHTNK